MQHTTTPTPTNPPPQPGAELDQRFSWQINLRQALSNALAGCVLGLTMAQTLGVSRELSALIFAAYGLITGSVMDVTSFVRRGRAQRTQPPQPQQQQQGDI